ncbi:MAG: hypothetical protein H6822_35820 [Planctomycetaceae bacterium]|nr:hypothetical protein [Planctomycetales bacterium]MCB9927558.1 hypothetical protein [Planctomycetaceae bacterium]
MNGLSLLVVLAAVGVDVGWESTSTGKLAYTIRIESLLIDKLGEGSAIESLVDQSDRGLRKFRVVVGPKSPQTERLAAATANEVDYGWRPNDSNGIDYYVQISRERLETLARGIPLECEVHPDVPEIEKIYVFVGDTPLPRELPQGATRPMTPPRDISSIGDSRGGNVAPVSGTDNNISAPRYGSTGYGSQSNVASTGTDTNRNTGYGTQPQVGSNSSSAYGPAAPTDYRNQTTVSTNGYGQYRDNTLPVPPLDTNRSTNYDYSRNQYAPQVDQYGRPLTNPAPGPAVGAPQGQVPSYGVQSPTYTTSTTSPPATNPAADALAATLAFTQSQLEKAQLEKERLALANLKPETKIEVAEAKPSSKPLILTTLALFASIGANAYLGWLAWSFFWRFRDAASDLSRARSSAFPASSIAGH